MAAFEAHGLRRRLAGLTLGTLAIGAGACWTLGLRAHLALAGLPREFEQRPLEVLPLARAEARALDDDAVAAYRWLRRELPPELAVVHALERLDRPGIVWIDESDRRSAPGLEAGLWRVGFELLYKRRELSLVVRRVTRE